MGKMLVRYKEEARKKKSLSKSSNTNHNNYKNMTNRTVVQVVILISFVTFWFATGNTELAAGALYGFFLGTLAFFKK